MVLLLSKSVLRNLFLRGSESFGSVRRHLFKVVNQKGVQECAEFSPLGIADAEDEASFPFGFCEESGELLRARSKLGLVQVWAESEQCEQFQLKSQHEKAGIFRHEHSNEGKQQVKQLGNGGIGFGGLLD